MKLQQTNVLVLRVEENGKILKQVTFYDNEEIELEQYYKEYRRRFPSATFSIQKPMAILKDGENYDY